MNGAEDIVRVKQRTGTAISLVANRAPHFKPFPRSKRDPFQQARSLPDKRFQKTQANRIRRIPGLLASTLVQEEVYSLRAYVGNKGNDGWELPHRELKWESPGGGDVSHIDCESAKERTRKDIIDNRSKYSEKGGHKNVDAICSEGNRTSEDNSLLRGGNNV